jgi:hypothetical protein
VTNWIDLLVALVWPAAGVFAFLFFGKELKALINRLRRLGPSGAEWWPQQPPPAGDPASSEPVTERPAGAPAPGKPGEVRAPRDYVAPIYRDLFDERLEIARNALQSTAGQFSVSKEEVLVAGVAELGAVLHLERASRSIFRSQLEALDSLGRQTGPLTLDSFRPFYDRAVQSFPEVYANYSFDQWFSFLIGNGLVILQNAMVAITRVGQVIGHYMIERGYTRALTY